LQATLSRVEAQDYLNPNSLIIAHLIADKRDFNTSPRLDELPT
jgi:hypothetical protein